MTVAGAWRRAGPGDIAGIEAFLARHATTSMFLRSNLAAHGLAGSTHRNATDVIMLKRGAEIEAVFGLTNSGYLMAQCPNSELDFADLRSFWAGRVVQGMTGDCGQVERVFVALGLDTTPCRLHRDEPLYALDLAKLRPPFDRLRAPSVADRALLTDWFVDHLIDTGFAGQSETLKSDARDRADSAIANATMRFLEFEGRPVAMTDFNAKVADIVQIGGVFVPRNLRRRGYGGRVVAGHLAEARAHGVNRAILFAASQGAAGCYESIGFAHIGTYRVALFASPTDIKGER